jgi:hypothetical protein
MAKSNWFEQAFGAVADEVGAAIADVRSKLIEEGFWGRKPPEPGRGGQDLGWIRQDEGARDNGVHNAPQPDPEQDHSIER